VTFPSSSWAPLARTTVSAALAPGSLVEIEAAARRR
jgi:enamine deaminase RidA (YjgF/YER057c/UK114 family)